MRLSAWKVLVLAVGLVFALTAVAVAFDEELYPGERELWEKAREEGGLNSYDTGPTWANWQGQFDAFTERYGIQINYNDLGSGATVVRLEKESNNPQADTAYYFMPFGALAAEKGLTAPFKPVNFERLPEMIRHPEGKWFSIHKGTVVFVINKRLVSETPTSWEELLDKRFRKSVVYLDPRTTGIGYALTIATTYAHGGDLDDMSPGIDYLAELQQAGNVRLIEKTTPFDKFVKGEIPVWITYDWNGYRAKYIAGLGDAVDLVIPEEGTITAPYAISMVEGAPHPNTAKLWLNFIMTDKGQGIFAKGFVRPSVPGVELPEEVAGKFLPASDYDRAQDVDWIKAQSVQEEAARMWGSKVLGED
ncbi:MAG: extracellular solute-binding protein [Synergistales bacterium]|nr:extracellular solute-binding protein [Synergistales bacterium]